MTIQPLIELLTQMHGAQLELLELAQSKRNIIIHNRTDELSKLTNQESRLVKKLSELETQRTQAIQSYLLEIGIKPGPGITLTELSKTVANAKEKTALLALQSQLSDVTARLKQQNNLNMELIRSSLEYIQFSLDLLSTTEDEHMTYRNPAAAKSGFKSGIFDTKA